MNLGLSLGLGSQRAGGAPMWTPANIFAASEVGYWLDPSDLTTMFQDTAATVPVTAAGQSVRRINDKSGNGFIFQASADARRPVLRLDGSNYYLDFDGTDDCLVTSTTIAPGAVDKCQIIAGVRKDITSARMIAEASANSGSNSGTFYFTAGTDTGALGASIDGYTSQGRGSVATAGTITQIAQAAPDTCVLAVTHDIAGDLSTIRRNGVAGTNATSDKGLGNFTTQTHYVGARGDASLRLDGRIYGLIVRYGAALSASDIAAAEAWMAAKTGVTL